MTKTIQSSTKPLPFNRKDPRQLRLFDDALDDQRDLLADIEALVLEICGRDRKKIIALNAELKRHYHPTEPRKACSVAMLRSILVGLQAERQSVAA
jgi:hypothetical protein